MEVDVDLRNILRKIYGIFADFSQKLFTIRSWIYSPNLNANMAGVVEKIKGRYIQLKSILLYLLSFSMCCFHLYVAAFGSKEAYYQRLIHLGFGLTITFLGLPNLRKKSKSSLVYDFLLFVFSIATIAYLLFNYEYIVFERFPYVEPFTRFQFIFGIVIVLLVLEATRRTVGLALTVITVVFLVYPFIGKWLPGILHHGNYSLRTVLDTIYLTTEGIFGVPIGVSATYLVLFILFGAFLEEAGFGLFLRNLAIAFAGRFRGGPAKVAIIASALLGSISGISIANVVTTGTFTIPIMKKCGYRKDFAGAVEASASTGAQFMPPVMGIQAFVMAQYTGIPYIHIIRYAILPAILYFFGLFCQVDFEAAKNRLWGITDETVVEPKRTILQFCHLLIPLGLLIYLLIEGFTPMFAVFYGIIAIIIVSYIRKETRINPRKFLHALQVGAQGSVPVIAASAASGIIIGMVVLTGLGMRFVNSIIDLSYGNVFLALLYSMFGAIVLGMGMPTVSAYIIMVALVIPALTGMGVSLVAAHLFVSYFACLSLITPPVALSSYAAAGISGGNMMKTSISAVRLSLSGYIIPFLFVFNPALLLVGSVADIVYSALSALLGVFLLSAGLERYLVNRMSVYTAIGTATAGFFMVLPSLATKIIGGIWLSVLFIIQKYPNLISSKLKHRDKIQK